MKVQKQPSKGVLLKNVYLKILQYSQENTFFNKVATVGLQLYGKKTPVQVFLCELCEIFKRNY